MTNGLIDKYSRHWRIWLPTPRLVLSWSFSRLAQTETTGGAAHLVRPLARESSDHPFFSIAQISTFLLNVLMNRLLYFFKITDSICLIRTFRVDLTLLSSRRLWGVACPYRIPGVVPPLLFPLASTFPGLAGHLRRSGGGCDSPVADHRLPLPPKAVRRCSLTLLRRWKVGRVDPSPAQVNFPDGNRVRCSLPNTVTIKSCPITP